MTTVISNERLPTLDLINFIMEDWVRQTTARADETTFQAIVTESANRMCAGGVEGSREVRLEDKSSIDEERKPPTPLEPLPRAPPLLLPLPRLPTLPPVRVRGCWGGRTSTGMAPM